MIMTIAKWILFMVLLAVLIIIISVVVWVIVGIVKWIRERRMRHERSQDDDRA